MSPSTPKVIPTQTEQLVSVVSIKSDNGKIGLSTKQADVEFFKRVKYNYIPKQTTGN